MRHKVKNIHFVGIGGSGMSGIAEVLANLGYSVSGSDLADNATTRRLAGLGVRIHVGHAEANVADADAVVVSTAVKAENPEVVAARARKVPIVPRAQMLAEYTYVAGENQVVATTTYVRQKGVDYIRKLLTTSEF